jgi:hypothetical protein
MLVHNLHNISEEITLKNPDLYERIILKTYLQEMGVKMVSGFT